MNILHFLYVTIQHKDQGEKNSVYSVFSLKKDIKETAEKLALLY